MCLAIEKFHRKRVPTDTKIQMRLIYRRPNNVMAIMVMALVMAAKMYIFCLCTYNCRQSVEFGFVFVFLILGSTSRMQWHISHKEKTFQTKYVFKWWWRRAYRINQSHGRLDAWWWVKYPYRYKYAGICRYINLNVFFLVFLFIYTINVIGFLEKLLVKDLFMCLLYWSQTIYKWMFTYMYRDKLKWNKRNVQIHGLYQNYMFFIWMNWRAKIFQIRKDFHVNSLNISVLLIWVFFKIQTTIPWCSSIHVRLRMNTFMCICRIANLRDVATCIL